MDKGPKELLKKKHMGSYTKAYVSSSVHTLLREDIPSLEKAYEKCRKLFS